MNLYEILDSNGNAVTGALTYKEAQRYMQKNRLNRTDYTIELHMPNRPKKADETMNVTQALEILKTWINLDATLTGDPVNLNRVSFILSEMTCGKMHVGTSWHHVLPAHRNADGTVRRDIHQLASEIAFNHHYGARELVELATA